MVPFVATNNWIVLAAPWSAKYFLLRIPIIPEKWWRKEEEERQLQSVMTFKQTQKPSFIVFIALSMYI